MRDYGNQDKVDKSILPNKSYGKGKGGDKDTSDSSLNKRIDALTFEQGLQDEVTLLNESSTGIRYFDGYDIISKIDENIKTIKEEIKDLKGKDLKKMKSLGEDLIALKDQRTAIKNQTEGEDKIFKIKEQDYIDQNWDVAEAISVTFDDDNLTADDMRDAIRKELKVKK